MELLDIWLAETHVENHYGPRTPRQAALAIETPSPTWTIVEDGFQVLFPYIVTFSDGTDVYAKIAVTFGLHFSSSQPMTEGTFEIFRDVNLPVNTWPFLREFVSTTLGRMGWQPFTLPAFKQGIPDDGDDDKEPAVPPKRRRGSGRTPS